MRVLVTFALETEFAPWRAMHNFRRGQWGKAEAYLAEIAGTEVGVVLTGVGPRVAGVRAAEVVRGEKQSIYACISSGLAGALKTEYAVGQVLAAKAVRVEAVDRDLNSAVLECSSALLSFALECGATGVNAFYTSERAIGRAEEKMHLGRIADAVDMESFDIVKEASAFGIPAIAIRAISDSANKDLPFDMNEVLTDEGQVSVPRVLGQVGRHPRAIPDLVRLANQSRSSAGVLAEFLDRFIHVITKSMQALEARSAHT
jgi:nucleoside phosphorylase